MEKEFNQIEYQNEYNKQKYDRITTLVPKGEKDIIKERAKEVGMSTNAFVYAAIKEKIERGE